MGTDFEMSNFDESTLVRLDTIKEEHIESTLPIIKEEIRKKSLDVKVEEES